MPVWLAALGLWTGTPQVEAMLYRPARVPGMGDQWLYYHDGVHYLYHLYEQPAGQLYGVYLATSTNGVHFQEVGPVVEKRPDAGWLGSGSVWRAGGRYIMNFSEARAHQTISFAESEDLVRWQRLGDEYRSGPDARWYEVDRWDCIWALPREAGGFWGYLSANPWRRSPEHPEGLTYRSTGMLESRDGVRWTAIAPPVFEWGETPEMGNVEVGAVRLFNRKYYLLVQTWGPYAGGTYLGSTAPGMYTFIGDSPQGPFRPDTTAFRLLGNTRTRSTHFARFYELPDAVLVNHFLFTRGLQAWLAPLKRAAVDAEGHLRLTYWSGNEALKGRSVPVVAAEARAADDPAARDGAGAPARRAELRVDGDRGLAVEWLGNRFAVADGIVLEGNLEFEPSEASPARCGLYLEESPGQGTAVLLGTDGRTELGPLRPGTIGAFETDDRVDGGIAVRRKHAFRLLSRRYMIEVYLDDRLVQCYSLPERATGRIGGVAQGGRAVFGDFRAWEMTLTGRDEGSNREAR